MAPLEAGDSSGGETDKPTDSRGKHEKRSCDFSRSLKFFYLESCQGAADQCYVKGFARTVDCARLGSASPIRNKHLAVA